MKIINTDYIPKSNIKYPEYTDMHYIKIKKDRNIKIDKNYPYVNKSKFFLFKKWLVRILLYLIIFPMTKIKLGLKVYGKNNLKKNKELLKNGVISVSNHINFFDYLAILRTVKPFKPYVLAWKKNINDKSGNLVRLVGGIPIPEDDIIASKAYFKSLNNLLNDNGWLHIYAEGSMWEYYRPIRPFKTGAAYLAIKNNKPILPIGFSYRRPGFIRRKIFRQIALININVGKPIMINNNLDLKNNTNELTKKIHKAVCDLAGISNNLYGPIYDESNNKKLD